MGCGDFRLDIIERLVEPRNLPNQNLCGPPGGAGKRRILFGKFDKLANAANALGGDNAELGEMVAQRVDAHRALLDEQLARLVQH